MPTFRRWGILLGTADSPVRYHGVGRDQYAPRSIRSAPIEAPLLPRRRGLIYW